MPKVVAVTGSSGFIGSHLTALLKQTNGIEVVEFEGDLNEVAQVEAFFANNNSIDQVVHLAGAAAGTDLEELVKANVLTTENLLKTAIKQGVKKIVLASSMGVYGEPMNKLSREDDPLRPDSAYGLSKMWAEDVVQYHNLMSGLEYVILRLGSVYGLGNAKGSIYSLQKSIEDTGQVTVYGDGNQTRSFIHVSDVCQAILKSINYDKSGVFNVSTEERLTINDVVKKLSDKSKFEVIRKPANNPSKDLAMDITKAKEELEFEPKITELQI